MTEQHSTLSRVADNLYWMSRYLERAENAARQLDVHLNIMMDLPPGTVEQQRLARLFGSLSVELSQENSRQALRELTFDSASPASILTAITSARENARNVREQISSEMWMQINKLYLQVKEANSSGSWLASPHDFYLEVKEGSHLFQGITDATMNHNQGWHFIQLGRYVERIVGLLHLLDVHFKGTPLSLQKAITTHEYFELVATLKSVTAFEAYCKVYSPNLQPILIIEFLLFNREFPRSLHFCVDMIMESLNELADATGRSKGTRLYRVAGRLQSKLAFDEIADVYDLHDYVENTITQIYQIHDTLYNTYITYPIESTL